MTHTRQALWIYREHMCCHVGRRWRSTPSTIVVQRRKSELTQLLRLPGCRASCRPWNAHKKNESTWITENPIITNFPIQTLRAKEDNKSLDIPFVFVFFNQSEKSSWTFHFSFHSFCLVHHAAGQVLGSENEIDEGNRRVVLVGSKLQLRCTPPDADGEQTWRFYSNIERKVLTQRFPCSLTNTQKYWITSPGVKMAS